ncbi:MAG: patatin-like phospholipase family protein [Gemmatimonadales bacterium]|jgi:NTE family protein|nr:patatin-like phospholipase family protein [Gemmatimonadales bacterium]
MADSGIELGGRPLALVLSGGGARAAYQVGVLSALAEIAPRLDIPILTGVSAGAINTVFLAAHQGPFRQAVGSLAGGWKRLTPNQVYAVHPLHIGQAMLRWTFNMIFPHRVPKPSLRGLMDADPLRGFLAAFTDVDGIQRNIVAGRLRAVALSATRYSTGETITFVQGTPDLTLWARHMRVAVRARVTVNHLMASAAIPLIFPAVRVGDAFYGDGSVRQTAPLAPAIHLGARRIIAISMRNRDPVGPTEVEADYPVAARVFGLLMHSVFLDSLDADAERLERLNELLALLPDPHAAPPGIRPVDLLMLRPTRDLGKLADGRTLELPGSVRFLVSSIGGSGRARTSDFLSYLMFEPGYIELLMELGYEDTIARREEVMQFLDAT